MVSVCDLNGIPVEVRSVPGGALVDLVFVEQWIIHFILHPGFFKIIEISAEKIIHGSLIEGQDGDHVREVKFIKRLEEDCRFWLQLDNILDVTHSFLFF